MRFNRCLLTGSLVLVALATGCDDQIATTAKSRAALDEAIVLIEQSGQGYVTGDSHADYRAFREGKLAEARTRLDAVIAQASDPVIKAGARRLLAGTNLSQAQADLQHAVNSYSRVAASSANLFNYLAAAQRINALIVSRGGDGGSILNALNEGQELIRENITKVNASLSDLTSQRESAMLKAEQLHSEASSDFTRAQEFEEQSRVAPNDQVKREVFTSAYSAQVDGQDAQRRAREQEINAEQYAAQIASLQSQLTQWNAMSQRIDTLKVQVQEAGDEAAREISEAGSSKNLVLAEVSEQIEAMTTLFENEVRGPLDAAANHADSAIQQLDEAINLADAQAKAGLNLEQIGARVELAQVLSRHAVYTRDFAAILETVRGNPGVANSSAVSSLESSQSELTSRATALTQRAQGVISEGLKQSETMASEDATGQASQALAQALRSYEQQLN